jgi:hypothetical protein
MTLASLRFLMRCTLVLTLGFHLFADDRVHSASEVSLIRKAHSDYLEGDFRSVVQTVKRILELLPSNPYIVENALELLERTRGLLGKKALPVDWKLPSGCEALELIERRKVSAQSEEKSLEFLGIISSGNRIKKLRVFSHPNHPVLDMEADLGNYEEESLLDRPGYSRFRLGRSLKLALKPGLYGFEIGMEGAREMRGWFILGQGNSFPKDQREKPTRILASERRLSLYQRALEQKILVLTSQRVQSFNPGLKEDALENIIHINQQDAYYFGELLIRKVLTSEVSFINP